MAPKKAPGELARGLLRKAGDITTERGVIAAMQANHDEKARAKRADAAERIGVVIIARFKAEAALQGLRQKARDALPSEVWSYEDQITRARETCDYLQLQIGRAIDGTRYRAALDLGDAPWNRIAAYVLRDVVEAYTGQPAGVGMTVPGWELRAADLIREIESAPGMGVR